MTVVNVHEAKTQLSRLLERVQKGEEIIVAKRGEPIARLVPMQRPGSDRVPGSARGAFYIADDFAAPLPEDLLKAFEQ